MSRADFARRTPTTIVVPAHNEGAVIGRCLAAVLGDAEPDEFSVLVVSNGSTDDTVEQAREAGERLGRPVEVLEVNVASKIAALRAAEETFRGEPPLARIYVDADVVVSTSALRSLVAAVDTAEPRLGLLKPEVDTAGSTVFVRAYYRAWAVLARARAQGSGSGVLAVNAAGAERLREWPMVLNDDGFVVRQFAAEERVVVDASARSYATRSAVALVRRRARVVNGNRELDTRWPMAPGSTGTSVRLAEIRRAVRRHQLPIRSAVVYVGVTAMARALAAWRRRAGTADQWSRDVTSRQGGA